MELYSAPCLAWFVISIAQHRAQSLALTFCSRSTCAPKPYLGAHKDIEGAMKMYELMYFPRGVQGDIG